MEQKSKAMNKIISDVHPEEHPIAQLQDAEGDVFVYISDVLFLMAKADTLARQDERKVITKELTEVSDGRLEEIQENYCKDRVKEAFEKGRLEGISQKCDYAYGGCVCYKTWREEMPTIEKYDNKIVALQKRIAELETSLKAQELLAQAWSKRVEKLEAENDIGRKSNEALQKRIAELETSLKAQELLAQAWKYQHDKCDLTLYKITCCIIPAVK